jgi:hypothetical protein
MYTHNPTKSIDNGPLSISDESVPVDYTLQLSPDAKIHPRFHVNILEPADLETPLQRTYRYESEEENVLEVERGSYTKARIRIKIS